MNIEKLNGLQEAMARDIPHVIACGLISLEDGLPVAGYVSDPGVDLEVPAGMFTQAFQSTQKAFDYSGWGRLDEMILSGPEVIIILFRVQNDFYQGIAVRPQSQLGLVRAVFKKYITEIEKALQE